MVIKPVAGLDGEGVLHVVDEDPLALYDFPFGDVSLEELLLLDRWDGSSEMASTMAVWLYDSTWTCADK